MVISDPTPVVWKGAPMRAIACRTLALLVLLPMFLAGYPARGPLVGAAPGDTAPQAYTVVDLGTLPGHPDDSVYSANALNATGQVAGNVYSAPHYAPFLYSGGTLSQLPTPGGIVESEAWGINGGGQVAGWTWDG